MLYCANSNNLEALEGAAPVHVAKTNANGTYESKGGSDGRLSNQTYEETFGPYMDTVSSPAPYYFSVCWARLF